MIAHRMSWFAHEHERACAGVKFFKDPLSASGVLLQVVCAITVHAPSL